MYIPRHFNVTDEREVAQFINSNSFGQLITNNNGRMVVSHIPFLFHAPTKRLFGHIAKANPQWQTLVGQEILVILSGPHGYITPSWYSHPGVPTWNYQAAHIYGTAVSFSDIEQLKGVVNGLTKEHESNFAEPWQADYDDNMLRGIVGIEIRISEIQCKYKLSQNRSSAEQEAIALQLKKQGEISLAEAMLHANANANANN
jgi:transcriptional regulator